MPVQNPRPTDIVPKLNTWKVISFPVEVALQRLSDLSNRSQRRKVTYFPILGTIPERTSQILYNRAFCGAMADLMASPRSQKIFKAKSILSFAKAKGNIEGFEGLFLSSIAILQSNGVFDGINPGFELIQSGLRVETIGGGLPATAMFDPTNNNVIVLGREAVSTMLSTDNGGPTISAYKDVRATAYSAANNQNVSKEFCRDLTKNVTTFIFATVGAGIGTAIEPGMGSIAGAGVGIVAASGVGVLVANDLCGNGAPDPGDPAPAAPGGEPGGGNDQGGPEAGGDQGGPEPSGDDHEGPEPEPSSGDHGGPEPSGDDHGGPEPEPSSGDHGGPEPSGDDHGGPEPSGDDHGGPESGGGEMPIYDGGGSIRDDPTSDPENGAVSGTSNTVPNDSILQRLISPIGSSVFSGRDLPQVTPVGENAVVVNFGGLGPYIRQALSPSGKIGGAGLGHAGGLGDLAGSSVTARSGGISHSLGQGDPVRPDLRAAAMSTALQLRGVATHSGKTYSKEQLEALSLIAEGLARFIAMAK
jgi:hypothetical protein